MPFSFHNLIVNVNVCFLSPPHRLLRLQTKLGIFLAVVALCLPAYLLWLVSSTTSNYDYTNIRDVPKDGQGVMVKIQTYNYLH